MSSPRLLFAAFALTAGGALAASAAAPVTLDLRPGLWEITSSSQTAGAPPIPQEMLDQMPPDRRAKLQAAMAASMARASHPHTRKTCVTPASLQKGLRFDERASSRCQQTVLSSSRSAMDVRVVCKGTHESTSGTMHFAAASPEAVSGTIDMVIGDGAHNMTVKSSISGKWLAADCGDVKPNE